MWGWFDAVLGWWGLTVDDLRREVAVAVLVAILFAAASVLFGAGSRWLSKRRHRLIEAKSANPTNRALSRKEIRRSSVTRLGSIISAALSVISATVVVGFLALFLFAPSQAPIASPEEERATPSPTAELTPDVTSPAPDPTPTRPDTRVSALDGCPSVAAADSVDESVVIDVLYWCTAEAFFDDGSLDLSKLMVKVRPMLRNASSQPARISIAAPSSVRLLVTGEDIDTLWSPPPVTAAGGDRPISVICDGQRLWAIPPNSPAETYPIVGNMYLGHATYWDFEELAPGEVLYKPVRYDGDGRVVKEANLVFTVPVVDLQDLGVYGLAVIDPNTGDVLGVSHIDDWPSKVLPSTF